MSTGTPVSASREKPAGFRVSIREEIFTIDAAAEDFCERLRIPVRKAPDRYPGPVDPITWKKWAQNSLPMTVLRIGQLLRLGMYLPNLGQPWAISVLEPLAELVGCDVVPRPEPEPRGSVTEEIAQASIAVSALVSAVDRGASQEELAAHLKRATDELEDVVEVSR